MEIIYHRNYLKSFKRRILGSPKLVDQLEQRIKIFIKDPKNPLLVDHSLIGNKNKYRAFSVTGDIRVIYKKIDDKIIFYDIGTHNQVY